MEDGEHMFKTVVNWGWCPTLITALAVVGYLYQWQIEAVAPVLIIILSIGLVVAVIRARDKELEISSVRLRQLAEYFSRRFMGNSALSIFAVIDTLFSMEDSKLWDWAWACDMSQRIFNTWCNSFISRMESDFRTRKFSIYLYVYLNELWTMNSHYYEFVEQLRELADKVEVPRETLDQYNRFVMEYNTFVQDFRDSIGVLRKAAGTGIEPASVRLATEISRVK